MSLVNVAPNCVMTSTTSLWGWFRLTVNLSLSQLCISNLCWCKTSSGTLLSPLFEFEFLLLIWLLKLALRGLNPGRFNCKWLTLLYSTKNRWTWCDKPWTKLTSLALPLWPNCLEFRKKKWVMTSPTILFTFSDNDFMYVFCPKQGLYTKINQLSVVFMAQLPRIWFKVCERMSYEESKNIITFADIPHRYWF